MSNIGLGIAFQELGIDSVMAPVGDRYVLEEMQSRGALIGGEDSGHLIFMQHHTTGDGIITALQLAAVMQKEGKPLSELAAIMKVYPQVLINIDTKSRPEIADVPEIMQAIRDVEAKLGDQGRVLVQIFRYAEPVPRHGRRADPGGNERLQSSNRRSRQKDFELKKSTSHKKWVTSSESNQKIF